MTEQELREKITEILASCLPDNDVRPRAMEIFDAFKEAGYKPPSIKTCNGCPDRFEGCVKLSKDQSLPTGVFNYEQHKRIFFEAGWRRVEISS